MTVLLEIDIEILIELADNILEGSLFITTCN